MEPLSARKLVVALQDKVATELREALRGGGYSVLEVGNPDEAIRLVQDDPRSMLLLDLNLVKTPSSMRRALAQEPVATVLLCSADNVKRAEPLVDLPTVDYTMSPVEPDDLLLRLRRLQHLRRHRQRRRDWVRMATDNAELARLGTKATGMVHTYNNLLGVVVARLQLIQRTVEADSKEWANAERAVDAARRMAEMSSQLALEARDDGLHQHSFDLLPVVRETLDDLASERRPDLQLDINFQMDRCRIRGIEKCIHNALIDIIEVACPPGEDTRRQVKIELTTVVHRPNQTDTDQECACLAISFDAAPGEFVPSEYERLRLNAAEGILRAHEGVVEIHIAATGRTTIRVALPCYGR